MTDRASPVLLAGVGSGSLEAIAPVLDQQNLEVTSADTPEDAVEMASRKKFDLVVFDAETDPVALADLVGRIRHDASRGQCSSDRSLHSDA